MISIAQLSDDPRYNIKTVCAETGIKAVTLRAWERRYNLLIPRRTEKQYRRYSEREIGILRWIKARVDQGVAIRIAINEWNSLIRKGVWPEVVPIPQQPASGSHPAQAEDYAASLYDAFACHDESQAEQVFKAARLSLDLRTLCLQIIVPTLIAIGEGWHKGRVPVATEHFASTFLRFQLGHIFQTIPIQHSVPQILCACAPGELHEMGILILAILLRQDGYQVEYLGQDVPVSALFDHAALQKPVLILVSATMEQSALAILDLYQMLSQLKPAPFLGFGGHAFSTNPHLKTRIPGIFLGETVERCEETIRKLQIAVKSM